MLKEYQILNNRRIVDVNSSNYFGTSGKKCPKMCFMSFYKL